MHGLTSLSFTRLESGPHKVCVRWPDGRERTTTVNYERGTMAEVFLNETLKIAARLVDVSSTRVARSASVFANSQRLVQPISQLAIELGESLDLTLPELTEDQIDKSPEANLHFMRGLGYQFAKMSEHALVAFMKALAIEPRHARARFWSGMTYPLKCQHCI